MITPEQAGVLRLIAAVLWRCVVFCVALLLLWFLIIVTAGDLVYGLHSRWFELTRHDFDLVFYAGMGLLKVFMITFFLAPCIAIHLVLRKTENPPRS